jgi:hypothetical protein
MNEFNVAYQSARGTADWAAERIQGRQFQPTVRNRLAGAAYGLALEHQRGMTVLAEAKTYGSTLALLRSAVESFALGYWLLYQANEDQLDAFKRGRMNHTLEPLLRRIADENPMGPRKEALQRLVQRLNALAHGGIQHLVLRIGSSTLGPQYSVEDMANALSIGVWVATMAVVDIVGGIMGDTGLAMKMRIEADDLFPRNRTVSAETDSDCVDT